MPSAFRSRITRNESVDRFGGGLPEACRALCRGAASLDGDGRHRPGRALSWVVPAVAVVAVARVETKALWPDVTFEDQRFFMQELARDLEEDDEVLVIGFPEFSVHTGRLSIWRWPYLWSGIDLVASRQTDGGFPAMLRELEEIRPELILRARRWDGKLRRQFDGWAIPRYRHETVRFHPHVHGRPIHVYRPRAGDERVSRRFDELPDPVISRFAAERGGDFETVHVRATIENRGCAPSPESRLRILISTGAEPPSGGAAPSASNGSRADVPVPPLGVRRKAEVSATFPLPSGEAIPARPSGTLPAGSLWARLDPDHEIEELEEERNRKRLDLSSLVVTAGTREREGAR